MTPPPPNSTPLPHPAPLPFPGGPRHRGRGRPHLPQLDEQQRRRRHDGPPRPDGPRREPAGEVLELVASLADRKSTRLNSSHANISYAVFCLKKKTHTLKTTAQ